MSADLAGFYDRHKTDHSILNERVRRIVELVEALKPRSVLDVGCGRGLLLTQLRERLPSARLVGTDISADSVARARAAGLEAECAEIASGLPFDDEAFDCVVFAEIIEHLVDPDAALVNISRILRTGGKLVLTTPNLAVWFNRLILLLGIQPVYTETSLHTNLGRRFRALGQYAATQGHLKIFTLGALREMLAANGFVVEHLEGAPVPKETWPRRYAGVARLVDAFFTRIVPLSSDFIVVARNAGTRETRYPVRSDERTGRL